MRWTLWAVIGAAMVGIGVVGLLSELGHSADIWRKGNGGIALIVIGGFCVWHGLSQRENGATPKPIGPTLLWLALLLAIGGVLYLLSPPVAFLYAIIVMIAVRFSVLANWISGE